MIEKKTIKEEELEKANGGYSPPEYDDCQNYQNPSNANDNNDNSKRDLDRIIQNTSTE